MNKLTILTCVLCMLFIILCGCNRERNKCFHLITKEHIELIHDAIPYIYAFTQGFDNDKTNNDTELTGIYYSIETVEAFFSYCPSCYVGVQNLIITRRDLLTSIVLNNNLTNPVSDECVQKAECRQASEAIALIKLWEMSHPKYACYINFDGFGTTCPEVCRSRETGYLSPYIPEKGGKRANLKDPWGINYSIIISDNKRQLIVSSAGPDQSFGTKDDISTTQDVATIINKGQKIKTAITPFFNALEEMAKQGQEEFNQYIEQEKCHLARNNWNVTRVFPPTKTQNGYFLLNYPRVERGGQLHIDASYTVCTQLHNYVEKLSNHQEAPASIKNNISKTIDECMNELLNSRRYEENDTIYKDLQDVAKECNGRWF